MHKITRVLFGCAMDPKKDKDFFYLWLFVVCVLLLWSFLYAVIFESFIVHIDYSMYQFKIDQIPDWLEVKLISFFAFFLFSMGVLMPLFAKFHRKVDIGYLIMRLGINSTAFMITTLFFYPILQIGFGIEIYFYDVFKKISELAEFTSSKSYIMAFI
jgi:hypothetical protein